MHITRFSAIAGNSLCNPVKDCLYPKVSAIAKAEQGCQQVAVETVQRSPGRWSLGDGESATGDPAVGE